MHRPFSKQTRPWMTDACIADMNKQWLDCMSKIPEPYREGLKEWAAVKVEMGVCHDFPEVRKACHRWGEQWVRRQMERGALDFKSVK
jgi:hypothetical protein